MRLETGGGMTPYTIVITKGQAIMQAATRITRRCQVERLSQKDRNRGKREGLGGSTVEDSATASLRGAHGARPLGRCGGVSASVC